MGFPHLPVGLLRLPVLSLSEEAGKTVVVYSMNIVDGLRVTVMLRVLVGFRAGSGAANTRSSSQYGNPTWSPLAHNVASCPRSSHMYSEWFNGSSPREQY